MQATAQDTVRGMEEAAEGTLMRQLAQELAGANSEREGISEETAPGSVRDPERPEKGLGVEAMRGEGAAEQRGALLRREALSPPPGSCGPPLRSLPGCPCPSDLIFLVRAKSSGRSPSPSGFHLTTDANERPT